MYPVQILRQTVGSLLQGPVWLPELHKLFFVSNRLGNQETTDQHVEMWTLDPETLETQEVVPSTPILMANGATNWAPTKVLVEQQVGHRTDPESLHAGSSVTHSTLAAPKSTACQ